MRAWFVRKDQTVRVTFKEHFYSSIAWFLRFSRVFQKGFRPFCGF